jgi:hypothetical protein
LAFSGRISFFDLIGQTPVDFMEHLTNRLFIKEKLNHDRHKPTNDSTIKIKGEQFA